MGLCFNFIFKRFLFYFGYSVITSLFSVIIATLGILWTPQLRDIKSLLNFAFNMKDIIEVYLPFNWKLPIPDIFQSKKIFVLSLGFLGLPILTFFYPIWFSNLLSYLDISPYLGILSRPVKGLLTYCFYYIVSRFTKDSSFYELPKVEWKTVFKKENKIVDSNNIQEYNFNQLDILLFLDNLFKELNLFYFQI